MSSCWKHLLANDVHVLIALSLLVLVNSEVYRNAARFPLPPRKLARQSSVTFVLQCNGP
jgi:hypothetical protein